MDFQPYVEKLAQHLGCTFTLDQENIEFKMNILLEGRRKQILKASLFKDMEEEIIRLTTPVGKRADLSERKLAATLELNSTLNYGAFALRNEELVMTETFSLHRTPLTEALHIAQYMTKMADSYEQMTTGLDRY